MNTEKEKLSKGIAALESGPPLPVSLDGDDFHAEIFGSGEDTTVSVTDGRTPFGNLRRGLLHSRDGTPNPPVERPKSLHLAWGWGGGGNWYH